VSERLKAILDQILALPKAERVELLGQLVESIDSPDDVEAAWTVEIRRRLDELHAGKAEVVGWGEARAAIHGSRQ
jgi:putative addiction module component (TIGR02574 family)